MLKITVQNLGDTSVVRCDGRIVAGDAGSILRNAVLSQRNSRMLVRGEANHRQWRLEGIEWPFDRRTRT